ncbi:hypothetical protein GCM10010228_13060 [Streptomyces massasporeus]|nr:hypothetical protein GCM10010228_13060 [Streptomyces massasporeus]
MPTALIVHAHSEPPLFGTAQMTAVARSLREGGYRVEVLDLYADGWVRRVVPARWRPRPPPPCMGCGRKSIAAPWPRG